MPFWEVVYSGFCVVELIGVAGNHESRVFARSGCVFLLLSFWELDGWMGKNEAEKEVEKKSATPPGISGTQ